MALNDAIFQAIELAVKTTGQQTITDLETRLRQIQGELANWGAKLKATTITTGEYIDATVSLQREYTELEASIQSANRVMNGLPAKMNEIRNGGRGAALAVLELSRGLEDLSTGGFLGILNNIPGIIMGIGQSANLSGPMVSGLTAGISGLATGFYVLYTHSDAFKKLVDSGFGLKEMARDIGLIRDPLNSAIGGMEGLKEQIDALNGKSLRLEQDFEAIRTLTREFEAAKKAASEFQAINNRMTEEQSAAKKAVADAVVDSGGAGHNLEDALNDIAKKQGLYGGTAEDYNQIQAHQRQAAIYQAAATAGVPGSQMLMKGELDKVNEIQERMDKDRRARLGGVVAMQDGEASRRELERMVADPANFGILAGHGIDANALRRGISNASPDAAARRKAIDDESKQDALDNTVGYDDFKKKQAEREAQDKRVAEAEQQVEDDQLSARLRENKDGATAHDKAVKEAVSRFGPGVDDSLYRVAANHAAAGEGLPRIQAGLAPQLRRNLVESGVPDKIADEVTNAILRKVMDKLGNKLNEAQVGGQGDIRGALAAGQDQAATRGQAAHLKTLALQEQMMGVFGPNSVQYAQVEAMQRNLQARMRMLEGRPARNRRPPGRQAIRP